MDSLHVQAQEVLCANSHALVRAILGNKARSFVGKPVRPRFDAESAFGTQGTTSFDGGTVKYVGDDYVIAREGRTKNLVNLAKVNLDACYHVEGAKIPAFSTNASMGLRLALGRGLKQNVEEGDLEQAEGYSVRTTTLQTAEGHMLDAFKKALGMAVKNSGVALDTEVLSTGFGPLLSSMSGGGLSGAEAIYGINAHTVRLEFYNIVQEIEGEPTSDFDFVMRFERDDFSAAIALDRGMDAWSLTVSFHEGEPGQFHEEGLYCEEPLVKLLEVVGKRAVCVGKPKDSLSMVSFD